MSRQEREMAAFLERDVRRARKIVSYWVGMLCSFFFGLYVFSLVLIRVRLTPGEEGTGTYLGDLLYQSSAVLIVVSLVVLATVWRIRMTIDYSERDFGRFPPRDQIGHESLSQEVRIDPVR